MSDKPTWPVGLYAPGSDLCVCQQCGKPHVADQQSQHCAECTIQRLFRAMVSAAVANYLKAEDAWLDLCEKSDRTSPLDCPDMALITSAELGRYMRLAAPVLTQAEIDVIAERKRQISAEGWTPEHDDEHDMGEMATAAACYADRSGGLTLRGLPRRWPWHRDWWKPSNPLTLEPSRRDLVKATALLIAEIERRDRKAVLDPL